MATRKGLHAGHSSRWPGCLHQGTDIVSHPWDESGGNLLAGQPLPPSRYGSRRFDLAEFDPRFADRGRRESVYPRPGNGPCSTVNRLFDQAFPRIIGQ